MKIVSHQKFLWLILPLIILLAVLSACGGDTASPVAQQPETASTPTLAAVQTATPTEVIDTETETPVPSPTPADTVTPTVVPPTETPQPTETATSAPTPVIPLAVSSTNLNIRSGPGTEFPKIGLLAEGGEASIIGRLADDSWWQITVIDSEEPGWVSAEYVSVQAIDDVPQVTPPVPPTPQATPTPAEPTATPIPTAPPVDFVVQGYRLWTNEENGGSSPGGSVTNCGYGHNVNVMVVDNAGNPLDGVTVGDIYGNTAQVTGSKGPGRAEFLIYNGTGWELLVKEYISAGRPVTSEQSPVLGGNATQIPIQMLIDAHYCATTEECQFRTEHNSLCFSHYSWDITFQRTW